MTTPFPGNTGPAGSGPSNWAGPGWPNSGDQPTAQQPQQASPTDAVTLGNSAPTYGSGRTPPGPPGYGPPGSGIPSGGQPTKSNGLTITLIFVAVLALIGSVAVLVLVLSSRNSAEVTVIDGSKDTRPVPHDPPPTESTAPLTVSVPRPTVTVAPPTQATMPPTTAPPSTQAPVAQSPGFLREQANRDFPGVQTELLNRWVAQLSTKYDGLNWEGRNWNEAAIAEEFLALNDQFGARLLDSSQWAFGKGGMWVTVMSTPFNTPEEALSWCAAVGRDKEHCFAKLIHTGAAYRGDAKYP